MNYCWKRNHLARYICTLVWIRLISVKLANGKYTKLRKKKKEEEMCSAFEVSIHVILVSFNYDVENVSAINIPSTSNHKLNNFLIFNVFLFIVKTHTLKIYYDNILKFTSTVSNCYEKTVYIYIYIFIYLFIYI